MNLAKTKENYFAKKLTKQIWFSSSNFMEVNLSEFWRFTQKVIIYWVKL